MVTRTSAQDTHAIRRRIRREMSALGASDRAALAGQAIEHFVGAPEFLRCKHIGLFFPVRHEISLLPLAEICWATNRRVYLPRILPGPFHKMVFHAFTPQSAMRANRFGIPEPDLPFKRHIPVRRLDMVVTPLLAFGSNGERLGMGGGFYDRTFSFIRRHPMLARPALWAVALDMQRVEFPANPWDVALHGVVTESGIWRFPK